MISARVFELAFAAALAEDVAIERVAAADWLEKARGDGRRRAFADAVGGFDFLCPDYRTAALAPLLVHLRNASGSRLRLLLIAHAPGVWPLEWVLLGPLLRAGDRIIVPTRSALDVVDCLSPALTPYVRVIPHPIAPVPSAGRRQPGRVVALTRIHPWKLLHRQIEAIALLRDAGVRVTYSIAGSLKGPSENGPSRYARSLAAKVRRLRLDDCIDFVGEINGDGRKAAFMGGAAVLVGLSVTVEESFGKAAAEALACGVPVLATRWDGLPETVGAGGACVPVADAGLGMDVGTEDLAEATRRLIEDPPTAELCRDEAERFRPDRVRALYRRELEAALEETDHGRGGGEIAHDGPAAPPDGLLAVTAPLTQYCWREVFDLHIGYAARGGALESPADIPSEYDELRSLLIAAIRRPLGRRMAGLPPSPPSDVIGHPAPPAPGGELIQKVAAAAASRGTRSSRTSCVGFLADVGRTRELEAALAAMRKDGSESPAIRYLEIEVLRQQGRSEEAFGLAVASDEPALRGELAAASIRQLAAIAVDLTVPALALPWLREWLERFPDAPGSGPAWLDRCVAALGHFPPLLTEARQALAAARELLGETPDVTELEVRLRRAELKDDVA